MTRLIMRVYTFVTGDHDGVITCVPASVSVHPARFKVVLITVNIRVLFFCRVLSNIAV